MDIKFNDAGEILTASLSGEIMLEDLSRFMEEFDDLPGQGITTVLLDVKNIEFMGSTSLSVIIALQRSLAESKIRLVICSPSAIVSQILSMTRLETALEIFPDRQTALESLGAGKSNRV